MNKNNSILPPNGDGSVSSIDALCRNSIALVQLTRKIAANQVNLIRLCQGQISETVFRKFVAEKPEKKHMNSSMRKPEVRTIEAAI